MFKGILHLPDGTSPEVDFPNASAQPVEVVAVSGGVPHFLRLRAGSAGPDYDHDPNAYVVLLDGAPDDGQTPQTPQTPGG